MHRAAAHHSPRISRPRRCSVRNVGVPVLLLAIAVQVYVLCRFQDALWRESPRPGERYVSDELFMDCLENLLERHGNQIPFLVIPVTLEYLDFKTFICALDAPVRHVMIVVSGDFPPLVALAGKMEERFLAHSRVLVRTHTDNPGYAACMNEGLRAALEYSAELVPWVLLSNSDVRYADGFWPNFMELIFNSTQQDARQRDTLQREKRSEARSVWPRGYHSSLDIVASPLLPDRIRHMSADKMSDAFSSHVGLFYASSTEDMCSFARTRLHIETVGYFDENYYPIYGEDHDLQWRSQALGFQHRCSPPGQMTHFARANMNALREDLHGRVVVQNRQLDTLWRQVRRMGQQRFRWSYRHAKWFPPSVPLGVTDKRHILPFNGSLPVDVWIRDTARIERIREIGQGAQSSNAYLDYDVSLLTPYTLHSTPAVNRTVTCKC